MKIVFCLVFALGLSGFLYSQTKINLDDVDQHIGDSVIVCGKVFSSRYMSNAEKTPTFLNIGAKYPDQKLTVVIWGEVRKQFPGMPEQDYYNKEICITGKLELYKEKPQIVIKSSGQIELQ